MCTYIGVGSLSLLITSRLKNHSTPNDLIILWVHNNIGSPCVCITMGKESPRAKTFTKCGTSTKSGPAFWERPHHRAGQRTTRQEGLGFRSSPAFWELIPNLTLTYFLKTNIP
jgi:hypothetical protein